MAINFSFSPKRVARFAVAALLAILTLGALALPAAPADAHEIGAERQVLIQVFRDRVDVAVFYSEAPGARSGLLISRFDVNGDGKLEGPEAELAGRALLPRMLGGLQFEVAGLRPRASVPQPKVRVPRGRLAGASVKSHELPPPAPVAHRTTPAPAPEGQRPA